MFEQKKMLAALATTLLLNACGGGGGSTPTTASSMSNETASGAGVAASTPAANAGGSSGTGTTAPTPADTGASGGAGKGTTAGTTAPANPGTTPSTGGTTPPGNTTAPPANTTTPPSGTTTPPATGGTNGQAPSSSDQQLKGYLAMVASQLVYLKADRSLYFPVTLDQFEGTTGMYDFASGSKGNTGTVNVPAPFAAPAAPLAAFGFRIDRFVQASTAGQVVANQTVVGRIAFNLTEQAGTIGIGANEVAERMSFVIDKVELASNANGELVSAQVLPGAQMVVTGRNAAGTEVSDTIPVPAGAVRLLPMWQVLDHEGDTSSIVLLVDLETAFSQAGQKLAALENIAGRFSLQVTLSAASLVRPAVAGGATPVARRDLVGQAITVGTQAPVTGSGVSGTAWVRMYPPGS